MVEGTFEKNNIAVQQALDELREDTADVTQVKEHLLELRKTKVGAGKPSCCAAILLVVVCYVIM